MRSLLLALGVSLLSVTVAHATPCGEVTSAGLCHDSRTLVFCEKGRLEQLQCPEGEVCTFDERFDGAAGCIATHAVGCGDVSEQGHCARDDLLLFCEQRAVVERRCPAGTQCTWVSDEGWYDCVPRGLEAMTPSEGEPDDGVSDPEEPGEPDVDPPPPEEAGSEPVLPSVVPGGAPAAEGFEASGGGCGGGAAGGWSLLGLIALGLGRRWSLLARRAQR